MENAYLPRRHIRAPDRKEVRKPIHRAPFIAARSTHHIPMLRWCQPPTSLEWIVERVGLEAVAQDEHVARILLSRLGNDGVLGHRDNFVLYELDFGVLETLQVLWGKDDALASGGVLDMSAPNISGIMHVCADSPMG